MRVWLVLMIFTVGCASQYQGPKPDFSLTGEAAKREYEKFEFPESFWRQGIGVQLMGPNEDLYTTESLRPVIESVSPRSWEQNERAQSRIRIGRYLLLGALALVVIELTDEDRHFSNEQAIAYWSLLGVSFGFNFSAGFVQKSASEMYNEDLRRKFSPALTVNVHY